jgi:hypothetical protein
MIAGPCGSGSTTLLFWVELSLRNAGSDPDLGRNDLFIINNKKYGINLLRHVNLYWRFFMEDWTLQP